MIRKYSVTLSLLSLAVLLAALPASAQEGEAPGHYDPLAGAHGGMTGKAMTNPDWWPIQLYLEILLQNAL
jgi:hypothetical protein